MKLAKERGVKVLLDGQGADELLAGYHSYFGSYFAELLTTMQLKKLFQELKCYSNNHANSKFNILKQGIIYPIIFIIPYTVRNMIKGLLFTSWMKPSFNKINKKKETTTIKYKNKFDNHLYTTLLITSLPALLHYEDRNSMAFSIESHVPFLDYRLVEFIFSLPNNQKIRDGTTKVVLRNAMKGILPEEVRNRMDKMGFVTPEDIWFRTVAKDKVLEIINSDSFKKRKYFKVDKIKKEFYAHCKGKKNISSTIWRWINLELWLRMFID